jgi:hypothetical protein
LENDFPLLPVSFPSGKVDGERGRETEEGSSKARHRFVKTGDAGAADEIESALPAPS